jgi:hypothetical protein
VRTGHSGFSPNAPGKTSSRRRSPPPGCGCAWPSAGRS